MELTKTFQKIATGDTVVYGGASGYLELWAKYNSQDIPNNRTNVTVELRLVVTHGYIGNYQATYWNINGDLSKSGNLGSGDYRSRTLGSVTGDIAHNLDGTKTISFSGEFNPTAWGYSMKVEGDATLPTLHTPPEIKSVNLVENNTKLTNLSVPNDTIVQYLSNKTFTINATYDDATISNCSIYHNNVLIGTSTTNEVVVDFSKVSELITTETNGTHYVGLTIAVTDSKSGYSTRIFNFPVIKYTRPTIEKTSTTIKRKTGWSEQQQKNLVLTDNFGALNFVGTCYKGNDVIGNANKPTVQYKIWNTTEPSYSTLTTPNTANVTIKDYEISDILYTSTYDYKIKIYDTFTTTETTINVKADKVPTGVSVWTEYKDRVDFLKITQQGQDAATKSDTQKHIVSAYLSNDYSTSVTAWASYRAKIDTANVTGDKLSFDSTNNRIVIGDGVSKIQMTGAVFFDGSTPKGQLRAWCMIRGTDGKDRFAVPAYQHMSSGTPIIVNVPTLVINVSPGEAVELILQTGASGTAKIIARGTSIFVEVIE